MSTTTTAAENSYNLRTARNAVARTLGIEDTASIDYSQRVEYNRQLAGFILQYPNGFTDAQLQSARIVAAKGYSEIADTSFDWGQFGDLFVDNAAGIVAAGSSWLKVLSVVAVLAALGYYILPGALAKASASKKGA